MTTRSLTLKLGLNKENNALALTVRTEEKDGDEERSEQHIVTAKDGFASDVALKKAATLAIDEYLAHLKEDARAAVDATPIGRAAKG